MIKPIRSFYLPSGRIIISKTNDEHFIESTEMRDVTVDGKNHEEVRETFDPKIIWRHLAPSKDKWLLTVSTQVGCTYACKFCDVANLGFKRNLTTDEIWQQIEILISSTPEIIWEGTTKAKIGFARMGEPMQNLLNVLEVIKYLNIFSNMRLYPIKWLPCFNSIVPRRVKLDSGKNISGLEALEQILNVKEKHLDGRLHLQISANSTDEEKRKELFSGADVISLEEIIHLINNSEITDRTVTLNFIMMKGVEVSVEKLMRYGLNPDKFAVKLIPLNATFNATKNALETEFNYSNFDSLKSLGEKFASLGIPVVTDAVCKAEEAGLCCGQLIYDYYK
jgi:adenine C2-methylase RlmN of 23S rRNA A2503 and tRNA A37